MADTVLVRKAKEEDVETIIDFNIEMAKETEAKTLNPDIVLRGVTYLMHNPESGFYLVAEKSGEILGSLMITSEWSDWRNGNFWWVQSVYVRPGARRQGIYSLLYRKVLEMAQQRGDICGIRLYVEENNRTAQKTYESLGMKDSAYRVYESSL